MIDQYYLGEGNVVEVENVFTKNLAIDDEEETYINNFFHVKQEDSTTEEAKMKEFLAVTEAEEDKHAALIDQAQSDSHIDHPFSIEPQFNGPIKITIRTQIQTNRRTNIYLDAPWPTDLVNKKIPVYYFPPFDDTMHEQLRSIEEPTQMWLTEMLRYYYGSSTYLEVQYWVKTPEGKMQLIGKCANHPGLIKMTGETAEEKSVSLEEVKWTKDTMVFGVNFNCTRTCFKSELYLFVRVRCGNFYLESGFQELPFRRSEKRKHDHSNDPSRPSKKLVRKATKKQQPTKSTKTEEKEQQILPEPMVPLEKVMISDVPAEVLQPITTESTFASELNRGSGSLSFNDLLSFDLWNP